MFPPTSRYYNTETAKLVAADGREIIYLRRRFLPDLRTIIVLAEHAVTEGDRLDNVAAQYLGDPEQFWLLGDANTELRPDNLTKTEAVGRRLRIPLPQ
jgi:hypothetical protein